jgi:hypothetical protein
LSFHPGWHARSRDQRDENHFAETRRRRQEVGRDRCEGPRRRPARLGRGDAAARQAQAGLHPPCRLRRQRHRHQRRSGGLYTGYPGGIKERSAKSILEGRFPERIVEKAVERMLPRGPLFRQILGNLRVYKGAEHPHTAQQPEALDVGALNRKNVSL